MTDRVCPWCASPVPENKRFCNPGHKNLFHTAARKWAEANVDAGLLSPGALREWHESAVHGEETAS